MKMFNVGETRMIGLPYGEKNYDDMLRRFHLIPERHGQTDRQTDRIAISISRVNVLTRDKKATRPNEVKNDAFGRPPNISGLVYLNFDLLTHKVDRFHALSFPR